MTLKQLIDIIYTASSLLGAYLIATNDPTLRLVGYLSFLTSSLTGIWLLLRSNASKSLAFVTFAFLLINIKGIISSL